MPRFKWGRRLSCGWIIHHHCLLQGYWDAKLLSLPDVLIQPSGQCLFYGLCHFYIGPNWQLFYGLTFPCRYHPPRSRLPCLSPRTKKRSVSALEDDLDEGHGLLNPDTISYLLPTVQWNTYQQNRATWWTTFRRKGKNKELQEKKERSKNRAEKQLEREMQEKLGIISLMLN